MPPSPQPGMPVRAAAAVATGRRVRRARRLVLALAVALVAGCGDENQPPPAPTPEPAPSSAAPAPTRSTPPPTPRPSVTAPAGFVALSSIDPTIIEDVRYATAHNFVGRPVTGYTEPICVLTRQAADALRRVQVAAQARGYRLKVYDCYRPLSAGDEFVRWARDPDDDRMRAEFYPTLAKSQLFPQGFIASPSSHNSGSTVDLTLVRTPAAPQPTFSPGQELRSCTAPAGRRYADNSIDMGTGYDCFESLSHTENPAVTGAARANRLLLRDLMRQQGFTNYSGEWWHYDYDDDPYPNRYFDFPVTRAALPGG